MRGSLVFNGRRWSPRFIVRRSELPQREDLLQALDVAGRVQAISRSGVEGGLEQADRVVVVQGADSESGPFGQFADFQGFERHARLSPGRRLGTADAWASYGLT